MKDKLKTEIRKAAAVGLCLLVVGCASQPAAVSSTGTRTLNEKTGLIVDDQGRAVSAATLRAQQKQALATAAPRRSGSSFWREWYSVENIQKRMAIGAMAGAAFQQNYYRHVEAMRPREPVSVASPTTYRMLNGSTIFSDEGIHRRIGNMWYHPDGETTLLIGNSIYNSDGTSTQRVGNTWYSSDGSSARKIGNTVYHSDGTTTRIVGNTLYHN
jgi:hypothetical protein